MFGRFISVRALVYILMIEARKNCGPSADIQFLDTDNQILQDTNLLEQTTAMCTLQYESHINQDLQDFRWQFYQMQEKMQKIVEFKQASTLGRADSMTAKVKQANPS